MASKDKSRQCPICDSESTERMGEFGLCLDCGAAFNHSPSDEIDTDESINESVGGTENE